jgi:hypothetical protein
MIFNPVAPMRVKIAVDINPQKSFEAEISACCNFCIVPFGHI